MNNVTVTIIAVQTIMVGKMTGLQDTSWMTTLEVGEYWELLLAVAQDQLCQRG
jgi:hypothetical protein